MRLLLVTPFYSPGVGGSSRLLQDIVDHLVRSKHLVEVITYGDSGDPRYAEFDRAQSYVIHRVDYLRGAGRSSISMFHRVLAVSRAGKFDLLLTGVAYPSAVIASVVKLLTRIPYSIYSHGEDVTCARDSLTKRIVLKHALANADQVMTNSNFSLREALLVGAREDRSQSMPPSIDPSGYEGVEPAAVEDLRERLGVGRRPLLLTVARLHARKGHDTVIRALKQIVRHVPDVLYLIVGKGDPSALHALAEAEGVRDHVKIVEYVSQADLLVVYHLCTVHVMVSRWDRQAHEVEGFGIVYLEAAACGKPSVAGNAGGSADAVLHGETGLVVDPESVEEVGGALLELLGDPAQASRLGAAGRKRVREHFAKDIMLPKIERLLVNQASRPGKGA